MSSLFIPFPFLIILFVLFLIALGGKCKDPSSQIIGNLIGLWSFVEFFIYLVLAITAYVTVSEIRLMLAVLFVWAVLILQNIIFAVYFIKVIQKDIAFQEYKKRQKKTSNVILIISALFSFKMTRFYYTRFFGLDYFTARFENKQLYQLPLHVISLINFVVTHLPILIIDVIGLIWFSSGITQFLITCIETIILIVLLLILTILEFRTGKILDYNPICEEDEDVFANLSPERQRERMIMDEMLRKLKKGEDIHEGRSDRSRDFLSLPDQLY